MSDLVLRWAERSESELLFRLHYWLGLPWSCKIRHLEPVKRNDYDPSTLCICESWYECPRCGHWYGHAADDPLGRGRVAA